MKTAPVPTRVTPSEPTGTEVSPTEELFARLYYAAEDPDIRGNATKCYALAYWNEHVNQEHDRYQSAATGGWRLLRRDRVRERMVEIRDEAEERAKERATSFWEDVPEARETLRWALTGDWPEEFEDDDQAKRSAVEAAKTILERAYGSVKLQHEHQLTGQAIVAVTAGPDQQQEPPEEFEEPEGREIPSPGPEIRGDGG